MFFYKCTKIIKIYSTRNNLWEKHVTRKSRYFLCIHATHITFEYEVQILDRKCIFFLIYLLWMSNRIIDKLQWLFHFNTQDWYSLMQISTKLVWIMFKILRINIILLILLPLFRRFIHACMIFLISILNLYIFEYITQ